jgi:hypothetical protein
MIAKITINYNATKSRLVLLLSILTICFLLRMILDMAESKFYGSAFYPSESILFNSFWWIFLPFILWQFSFTNRYNTRLANVAIVAIPIVAHFLAYPSIIWLVSELFLSHTYSYWQTLTYELTEYSFILITAYSVPFTLYTFFKSKLLFKPNTSDELELPKPNSNLKSLLVMDNNERMMISINDILYFSANSPYINIHHKQKRYLHNETLKSLSQRLDNEMFVRVHKSVIVNIKNVLSYKSRLNGDYDLTMSDGTEIRLSRNYASSFKQKLEGAHQDTTK